MEILMRKHKHHIVPRHAGGNDDSLNITPPISVRMHAMFHYDRWLALHESGDYHAWRMLMGDSDVVAASRAASNTPAKRLANSMRMKDLWAGLAYAEQQRNAHADQIPWHAGQPWSEDHRKRLSEGQLRRFQRPEEIEKLRSSHLGKAPSMKGKHFPVDHPARTKKMGDNNPMRKKKMQEVSSV